MLQMEQNNPNSITAIQPELASGESVVWAGQPSGTFVFHKEDLFLVPFSLLWGGFAIFWELGVAGFWGSSQHSGNPWIFGVLWGIPFVLVGQYMIWGRFFYSAWKKKRTYYAVTNRRVIAVQDAWRRQMASAYLDSLPTLTKEGTSSGVGTLRFAQTESLLYGRRGWGAWDGMAVGNIPTFVDIDDVDYVYRIVSDLREKARTPRTFA
jgi:hypothetical protein